ncbi:hypothetical protein B5V89_00595 [Heyndrickxia sporothermodurans]|uniref:glycosyltransferase n=1 Tax=Heyndrickxia sporothermodurans TaxID=46224 RepID=UPI000D3CEFE8|nr:glycosyltransferase [Heyndrickxia sporothermodurans]PTY80819.1 hypothetical protein B5V89_00595 [Heyndrickxia sporothermodurans]
MFPMNSKYYFLVSIIKYDFGGLTNSMLQRARIFTEKVGVDSTILTFDYNPDYEGIINRLWELNKINEKIKILNMYDFFKNRSNDSLYKNNIDDHVIQEKENGYFAEKVKGKNAYRYFNNGLYVKYKSFEKPNGKLKFIDYVNENRSRTRREEFDDFGRIRKTTYYDFLHNLPKQELFFDELGNCFMSKWHKLDKSSSRVEKVIWFNEKGEIKKVFFSDLELKQFWLTQLTEDQFNHFFIVDGRNEDQTALLDKKNIFTINVIHSIHIRPPYEPGSKLRLGHRFIFNNAEKTDGIVLLTEGQKKDVEEQFGHRNNYFVIPHAYGRPNDIGVFDGEEKYKAVIIARYREVKQLDHAIRAFALVCKEFPNATLDIYGFGPEEENLRKLIKQLHLINNVFLKGFTNNVAEIYKSANVSLLTSDHEGFGMVVLESLANGCPVISYDIKYGPSDMIQNEYNGYLVKANEWEHLAEKIVVLFKNPLLQKEMRINSYNSVIKFNEENFINRWSNLFQTVIEQKDKRSPISNMSFELDSFEVEDSNNGIYKIKGNLLYKGENPSNYLDEIKVFWKIVERSSGEEIINDAKLLTSDDSLFEVEGELNFHNKVFQGRWDLAIVLQWSNFSFLGRVTIDENDSVYLEKKWVKSKNDLIIVPYLTKNKNNLAFQVKPTINNKTEKKTGFLKKIGLVR